MGYYENRAYRGYVDTYERSSDVAVPTNISSPNITQREKYNNRKNDWRPDNLTKSEAKESPNSIIPKAGAATKVTYNKNGFDTSNLNGLSNIIDNINRSVGIQNNTDTLSNTMTRMMTKYNRFKIPELNVQMSRCFGHVFFTRPSCNILDSTKKLIPGILDRNPVFMYAYNTCKGLLEELTSIGVDKCDSDFNLLLSNTSKGFALNDETLQTTTYGTTFSGYKVSYGKDDVESKTAGEFSTTFIDDKRIHVYRLIKLWVEYIAGVYRGRITPSENSELNRILDYVSSVYYILTAEDGETILFWTKYFGVYPTTIPSSQYSWQHGELLSPNEIQVNFTYSWKQDFDPKDLIAFNYNARQTNSNYEYSRIYDTELLMPGPTWVGSPFIEFVRSRDGEEPSYKLRFK